MLALDPQGEEAQRERLARLRARRDGAAVEAALAEVTRVARDGGNLLYPMKAALERSATLGEVSSALLEVFGRYRPSS